MTVGQLALELESAPGISTDAATLRDLSSRFFAESSHSMVIDERQWKTKTILAEAFFEASSTNWDGYGAEPANLSAYAYAYTFLTAMPTTVPLPEVAVEPDGEMALEWFSGPRAVFSVSIGSDGELTYAGIFGRDTAHGMEHLVDEIPETILHNLGRVISP